LKVSEPVFRWTGVEVRALRQAMRLGVRDFAAYLGVSDRMVSKWEAGGAGLAPRQVNQAALDTCLARVSDDVRARFVDWPAVDRFQGEEKGRWILHVLLDVSSVQDAIRLADRVLAPAVAMSTLVGREALVAPEDRPLRGYRVPTLPPVPAIRSPTSTWRSSAVVEREA
jgi:transcriptional regulator with XRE-family HTH domain